MSTAADEAAKNDDAARETARAARLRYSSAATPGIRREREGDGFAYFRPNGERIGDPAELARIAALAIPPAWSDVWICPAANGHLQATGRDARGRKQYRYHSRWRAARDETKYAHMLAFADALPRIRERVRRDLARSGLPREKVLAAVVDLLDRTSIRVGNQEYARENRSFGLTTLRERHVQIDGSEIRFRFRGKSGKQHCISLRDRRLAAIVRRCRDLPGYELFQYLDDDGNERVVDAADVNDYLHAIAAENFTAKDFRTWNGTVAAALALQEFESFDSQAQAKSNVVRAIEQVAARLGNTPAVCRKCYVHPAVIESYLDGDLVETLRRAAARQSADQLAGLEPEAAAVLALLRARPERESRTRRRAV